MINQNWIFPQNCGLKFQDSANPPTSFSWSRKTIGYSPQPPSPPPPSGYVPAREGCASISDDKGNLLFYTDGVAIWDANHTQQYFGLKGDGSSTQSSIIVPDPGNSKQYYIFTTDGSSNSTPPFNHFDGVRLDINNLSNPTPIFPNILPSPENKGFSPVEKITAIQHTNCRDFWIISIVQQIRTGASEPVRNAPGIFRVFLVDPNGIQYMGPTAMNTSVSEGGYLKGSPSGQFLAMADGSNQYVLVYPFDKTNGTLDIPASITIKAPNGENPYGVEFSPDSRLLYYSNLVLRKTGNPPAKVWQVDFLNSITSMEVGAFNRAPGLGRYQIGALQLGIDNRIYIAKDGHDKLAAILNPNVIGLGCTVMDDYLPLVEDCRCQLGLPNLLPNPCKGCDCSCTNCNKEAEQQNEELKDRAQGKTHHIPSHPSCPPAFQGECKKQVITGRINLEPCFHFHWGDSATDQIEEHDTEVFYLTVCNNFKDIQYKGLRITKVELIPDIHPLDKIQIIPDRFICIDCLDPCSCQTREFALITRANDIAGSYKLVVEYCYEEIAIYKSASQGKVGFPIEIMTD